MECCDMMGLEVVFSQVLCSWFEKVECDGMEIAAHHQEW
jgi:hypothetical protein